MRRLVSGLTLASLLTLASPCKAEHISKYSDNSYCIRKVGAGKDANNKDITGDIGYGTAFIIDTAFKTYFVTNRHIVSNDNVVPDGVTLKQVYFTICDSVRDNDYSDDLVLRLVAVDDDSDTAILEYDGTIHHNKAKRERRPNYGDKVFSFGFPMGIGKFYHEGVVATERTYKTSVFGDTYFVTINAIPGDSGSPVYIHKDDEILLLGHILGFLDSGQMTAVVPIAQADDLLKSFRKNPKQAKEQLEKLVVGYSFVEPK